MKVTLARPWLEASFDTPLRMLSWALNRPGFCMADRIVWREVRNADLPKDFEVARWFTTELAESGRADAIGFLTSRNVTRFTRATAIVDGITATVVATTGLSNAERIGQRGKPFDFGTINIAVAVAKPLSDAALIEAMSIAVQARTVAVMTHGRDLPQGRATGTGTDCIAIAAPPGDEVHAGMHTATGHAVGAAVLDAVNQGVQDWMKEHGGRT